MTRWDTLQPPDIYLSEAVNEIYIFLHSILLFSTTLSSAIFLINKTNITNKKHGCLGCGGGSWGERN